MNRPILSRLGPIVVLLLAILTVSGCDNDENTSSYGGPYHIGGTKKVPAMADAKNAEFIAFNNKKWDSSVVVELKKGTFEGSIKSNSKSGVPYANEFQRYNYVIKKGKIFVAVWRGSNNNTVSDICNSGLPYKDMTVEPGTMVNFYPETIGYPPSNLDCILTVGNRKTGVLDAHSKHFMLVQGKENKISNYQKGWEEETVDYAGEIIVYLTPSPCYYVINQGSGTYIPKAGISGKNEFGHLEAVAKFFEQQISVPPKFLWRTDTEIRIPFNGSSSLLSCR